MGETASETVNLIDPTGATIAVPVNQVASALAQPGFRVETAQDAAARLGGEARQESYGGVVGTGIATLAGGARGLTLGASDVLADVIGEGEALQGYREANPLASTIGEVGGAVAGAFAAPGSLLARTPAGMVSRLGSRIAGAGVESGMLGRTAYAVAGGATEGALQNAGAYISDVALGDRELSADGFMGAMGKGALWGGVASGALSVASDGFMAARRLFPRQEMTREAVQAAEDVAKREIATAVDDSKSLEVQARQRLREIREQRAAVDLETKIKLDEIAVRKADELAQLEARTATAKAETAEARLERTKAGPQRRTRKALQDEEVKPAVPEPTQTAAQPEVVAGATEDASTLLERQLMAMKQGIDEGQSLADLAAKRPTTIGNRSTHIEDALNAEIALRDPEAEKLVRGLTELTQSRTVMDEWLSKYGGGQVAKFERAQAARDVAESWRPKEAGYYSQVPAGEGTVGLPRGREMVWRGSDEARAIEDARIMSKVSPEEQLAADEAVEAAFRRRKLGERVTEGEPPPVDEQVGQALRSKVDDIDDDIKASADAIGRHEAAQAELVDALGPRATPSAQARSAAFRGAQRKAETKVTEQAAEATAQAEQAAETIALGGVPPKARGLGGLMERAQDIGTMGEAMRMLGIPVPDPSAIPVIGPLLSAYLKARVLSKSFGRFGGKVAETAESTIAKKAAETKQRVYAAVDKLLEGATKGTRAASQKSGGPAAILGHTLFDDDEPKKRTAYSSQAPKGSLGDVYLARADEVSRAMQPGAIARAVKDRVKASDPEVMSAIVAAQERKLQFLDSKMPKPLEPAIPTGPRMPWVPSKAEISQWARYVQAAEDPVGVLEAAANGGHLTVEGVETLKTVYPKLFAEAQARALTKAMDMVNPMPYQRRVQLSIMLDMPMDASQTPQGAAFLQSSYQPTPPVPTPQAPTGTPTVTADVGFSERTSPETRR